MPLVRGYKYINVLLRCVKNSDIYGVVENWFKGLSFTTETKISSFLQ